MWGQARSCSLHTYLQSASDTGPESCSGRGSWPKVSADIPIYRGTFSATPLLHQEAWSIWLITSARRFASIFLLIYPCPCGTLLPIYKKPRPRSQSRPSSLLSLIQDLRAGSPISLWSRDSCWTSSFLYFLPANPLRCHWSPPGSPKFTRCLPSLQSGSPGLAIPLMHLYNFFSFPLSRPICHAQISILGATCYGVELWGPPPPLLKNMLKPWPECLRN